MTRVHFLLSIACATGAAATIAPTSHGRTAPAPSAAGTATVTAKGVPARGPGEEVAWLAGFGTYNGRKGTWNFVVNPRGC
ncbi:MAG: hypothetical protein ACHQ2E_06170 [Gemmatimonadales bacterium]